VDRVGVIVKEWTYSVLNEMHHSVTRALGSTLLILITGSNVGFTGRGFWDMAIGCML
jgi:hypothetical protein